MKKNRKDHRHPCFEPNVKKAWDLRHHERERADQRPAGCRRPRPPTQHPSDRSAPPGTISLPCRFAVVPKGTIRHLTRERERKQQHTSRVAQNNRRRQTRARPQERAMKSAKPIKPAFLHPSTLPAPANQAACAAFAQGFAQYQVWYMRRRLRPIDKRIHQIRGRRGPAGGWFACG